jgi:hypothetical protein
MDRGGRKTELGIALPVALFALVVIGALVAGNFFAGRLEHQAGQYSVYRSQAIEAAEAGLTDVVATAVLSGIASLPVGGMPMDLGTVAAGTGVSVSRQITRLTATLFLIRVTGVRQNGAGTAIATHSLGLIARLVTSPGTPDPALPAERLVPLRERAWVPWY